MRVSCEAAAKWRHCRSLEPARVGWLAACLLGGRTREKKKNHHHHYSPVVVSAAPLPPTNKRSSRSAAAAHWRTRSSEPSAQSQDPQSPQPIRGYTGGPGAAGGWGKKKGGGKRLPDDPFFTTAPPPLPPPFRPPTLAPPTPRTDASPATFLCLSLPLSFCSRGSLRVFARPVISTGAFGSTDNTKKGSSRSDSAPLPTHG